MYRITVINESLSTNGCHQSLQLKLYTVNDYRQGNKKNIMCAQCVNDRWYEKAFEKIFSEFFESKIFEFEESKWFLTSRKINTMIYGYKRC